ncbi:MAG: ABC transporter ATP-binding protein [Selenomonadaceae bacterium]|nr:ABC transporter ATP-binding protein [Selenomonadaceae bacterium]
MTENILTLEKISVAYGEKKILHDINFSVKCGEILAVVGESGSGKSTILKAVDGLLGKGGKITDGKIFFSGREITNLSDDERRKISSAEIGMIFQNAGASFCPIRTIGEQIFESVVAHKNWTKKEFLNRAKIIMKNINLDENILNEFPFKLSGGMAQRAGILAAMILEPKILLADEPTSSLDAITQIGVVKELLKLRERHGISIILVTHHMGAAWYMADKILIMKNGRAVEFGTKEKIFNSPQEIYTKELIKAVPRF